MAQKVVAQKGMAVKPPWVLKRSKRFDGRWYFYNPETKKSEWTLDSSMASAPERAKEVVTPPLMSSPPPIQHDLKGTGIGSGLGLLPKVRGISTSESDSGSEDVLSPAGRARRPSWTETAHLSARRNSLGELADFYDHQAGAGALSKESPPDVKSSTNNNSSAVNGHGTSSSSPSLSGSSGLRGGPSPYPPLYSSGLSASWEDSANDFLGDVQPSPRSGRATKHRPLPVDTKKPTTTTPTMSNKARGGAENSATAAAAGSTPDSLGSQTSPSALHSPYTSFAFTPFRSPPEVVGTLTKSYSVSDVNANQTENAFQGGFRHGRGGEGGGCSSPKTRSGLNNNNNNGVGVGGGSGGGGGCCCGSDGLISGGGGGSGTGVGFMRHAPDHGQGTMVDPMAERMRLISISGQQNDLLNSKKKNPTMSGSRVSSGSSSNGGGLSPVLGSFASPSGAAVPPSFLPEPLLGAEPQGEPPVPTKVLYSVPTSPKGAPSNSSSSSQLLPMRPSPFASASGRTRGRALSDMSQATASMLSIEGATNLRTRGGAGTEGAGQGGAGGGATAASGAAAAEAWTEGGSSSSSSSSSSGSSGGGGKGDGGDPTEPPSPTDLLAKSLPLSGLSAISEPVPSGSESARGKSLGGSGGVALGQQGAPRGEGTSSTKKVSSLSSSTSSPPMSLTLSPLSPWSPSSASSTGSACLGSSPPLDGISGSQSAAPTTKNHNPLGSMPPPLKSQSSRRSVSAIGADDGVNFEGRFVVTGGLGMGGYSIVVMVEDSTTGEPFAMKVTLKSRVTRGRDRKRLRSELKVMRDLPFSPFLERCHAAFESPSRLFFILDYNAGGDLFYHLVRRVKATSGGFTEAECRTLLAELVLALEHLHGLGFVHRDIKVENIMLDSKGHVKLIDFGLACEIKAEEEPLSPTGSLIYMAPELLKDNLGGRFTDWWAVGVLAHELLTGRTPWSSLTDKALIQREIATMRVAPPAAVTPAAGKFVCGLLHQDRSRRLGTSASSEVRAASFFKAVDWGAAERLGLSPALGIPTRNNIAPPAGGGGGRGGGGRGGGGGSFSGCGGCGCDDGGPPGGGAFDPDDCQAILDKYVRGGDDELAVTMDSSREDGANGGGSGGGNGGEGEGGSSHKGGKTFSLGLAAVNASPAVGLPMPGRHHRGESSNSRNDYYDDGGGSGGGDEDDEGLYGWDDDDDDGSNRRAASIEGFSPAFGGRGGGGGGGFSIFGGGGASGGRGGGGGCSGGGGGGGGWDRPPRRESPATPQYDQDQELREPPLEDEDGSEYPIEASRSSGGARNGTSGW